MSTPPLKLEDPFNLLWPFVAGYRDWFEVGRYGPTQIRRYTACVLHFGDWARSSNLAASDLDEVAVQRFLDDHLPRCECPRPIPRGLVNNRAALTHLVRHLRDLGIIAVRRPDEIARELEAFNQRMVTVWGMTAGTRSHRCRIMRRLFRAAFGSGPIDIASLTPQMIRAFVLGDRQWSPSTVRVMAGAVRCYLRHRTLLGDDVRHLHRAVPRAAAWGKGALPSGLTDEELDQLLHAFDGPCPSRRRGYAIVRCLVDLGLRTSEVIGLRLEDIDWEAGILRLSAGKGRRASTLPLPAKTGEAIVSYLMHERPQTGRREIFVRHVGPRGGPVGRRVVQRTLHAAYKRLGWDRTRVHILRHTLGGRLVNSGASMKQIADVLRHRSIQTAAGYTRVDIARLSAVALPWPGDVA